MSTRHFKKYVNRKFYDEDLGKYASVRAIAAVVKKGDAVEMTCDRTGRDLTLEILTRILYEEVRRAGKAGARGAGRIVAGKPDVVFRGTVLAGLAPAEVSRLIRLF
jgi:hypothetical protein